MFVQCDNSSPFNLLFVHILCILLFCVCSDADPLGLHCLTALRWLELLLLKCKQAFTVQMDGSLCSHAPVPHEYHAPRRCEHEEGGSGEEPDLAGKLVRFCFCFCKLV